MPCTSGLHPVNKEIQEDIDELGVLVLREYTLLSLATNGYFT
jgi:hypothetical protein